MKRSHIFFLQSVYYFITGLWPIIDIASFMKVTGPKTDIWLVKMVGLLTVAISITLFTSYKKNHDTLTILSITAALSYLAIDVHYYFNDTIRAVYLGDAVAEVLIIILVLIAKPSRTD